MHMNDCRRQGEVEMRHDRKQLKSIIETIKFLVPATQNRDDEIVVLSARDNDLGYISEGLSILGTEISELRNEVGGIFAN